MWQLNGLCVPRLDHTFEKEKDIVTLGEVRKWTHPLPQGTGTDHRHVKSCGVRHVPCSAEGREAVSLERAVEAGSRP